MRQRQPREKDERHRDFIQSLPCLICGENTTVEAAHIRFGDRRVAKRSLGTGEKSDDSWTVPLCGAHHREQHSFGEQQWWRVVAVDPIFYAMALYRVSGDTESGEAIIARALEE